MAHDATLARVRILLGARRFAEAVQLLAGAADRGEPSALAELAQWRISGDIVQRDLAAARELLARAAGAGDTSAALLHASFLASGVGGGPDWPSALARLRMLAPLVPAAAAQLELLGKMDLDRSGAPRGTFERRRHSDAPLVETCASLLTAEECAYLAAAGEPTLQPSVVVDPSTGRMVPHPVRTSDGTMFGVYSEDLVVNAINRRIAALTGTQSDQGEPLQLLRYRPGGEYRAHMDALPAEPNQRVMTAIVYLTDDYEGGETRFLRTGLSFRGRRGDAIMFRNVTGEGRPDEMSVHAGLPVTRGVKLIATRWIREARFTYPAPRPLVAF